MHMEALHISKSSKSKMEENRMDFVQYAKEKRNDK